MMRVTRRTFLKTSASLGAGVAFLPGAVDRVLGQTGISSLQTYPDLAVARGGDPAKNCRAALEAIGGLGRFVKAGQRVVLKPNPVGNYPPERAINTHPEVVRVVVQECVRLGAREVTLISHDEARSFVDTGLAKAIEESGGRWKAIGQKTEFREVLIPRGRALRRTELAEDLLKADVFINLPIAKHHAGSQVTLAMKNLMGLNWDRLTLHNVGLHQGIAELATAVKQDLVIMDANYVLLSNGPVGPGRVQNLKQVLVCADPVAIDAYATRFFGLKPQGVEHIRMAYELGAGEIDLDKLMIREFDV